MTQAFDDYLPEEAASEPAGTLETTVRLDTIDVDHAPPATVLDFDRSRPAADKFERRQPRAGYSTRRLRGLDGLRAIAVLSVVVFHLDFSLAPGGFLGVDVFFVISGFLITNLLAVEILDSGRLRLGRFYLRRARRLLPAVVALMVAVALAAHAVWHDQLGGVRGGIGSSLTYVTNWWLIADHQSYFDFTNRPSMFQHLWSLAIEEQFYLVWSAVVVLVVLGGRARGGLDPARRLRYVAITASVLAAASTALMAFFAVRSDLPYGGSTSRVYFGSDTHSMGLFLGSAAGAWWALHRRGTPIAPPQARARLVGLTDLIGAGAVIVLCRQFFVINEYTPGLYRGGFLAFDGVVLLAILCAVRTGSLFSRVLDMRPIRWLGQRSYSIYIWHWPVAVVTRPGLDIPGPLWLVNAARLALILSLSALTYQLIEVPLRSGQFAEWRRARRTRAARRGQLIAVVTAALTAGTFFLVAHPVGTAGAPPLLPDPSAATSTHPSPAPGTTTRPTGSATAPPSASGSSRPAAPGGGHPAPTHQAPAAGSGRPAVSAFGDSVLLGAATALRGRTSTLSLDAIEGRQAYAVLDDITAAARRHALQADVVIHVGDNGVISPDQLRSTLRALGDRHRIVLINNRVARDWQDPNNHTIASVGKQFRNVVLLDWHTLAARHKSWLYRDGLHLTVQGAAGYSRAVLTALR